jgi:hypothetical protein
MLEISSRLAPSEAQRTELSDRYVLLVDKMRPATHDEVSTWITRLIAGFGGPNLNREEAQASVTLYSVLLDGLPVWAIKKAVLAYLKGTVAREDQRFAPTPPEFCRVVRGYTDEFAVEMAKLRKVLDATVYVEPSAEQKARVDAVMSDHLRALKASGTILERDADGRLTPRGREALAERVVREARAAAAAQRKSDAPRPADVPPPELSDPDAQKLWYQDRLEALKAEPKREYKLSDAIKATNAGRPAGAPDITYGPAQPAQEAAE